MSITHILVVDDDARLRPLLAKYLGNQPGWQVTVAEDAEDARRKLEMFIFDLLVLDVMMPGETGLELAASLRGQGAAPILMLTAMGEADDRIAGLEAGVDDYLAKPFDPRELVLRIRNILRRGRTEKTGGENALAFGAFRFYPAEGRLLRGDAPIYLTSVEAALLTGLARRPGEAVSRTVLAAELPGAAGNERSVDVQITRLRKKIEATPSRPVYIQTVRGTGYALRVGGNVVLM